MLDCIMIPTSTRAFPPGRLLYGPHRDFMLWALHLRAGFHLGLARPLSRRSVFITGQTRQPTPFRALRRPLEARHGITIEDP